MTEMVKKCRATAVEMEKNLTESESITIQWTKEDRCQLYFIIEREWSKLDTHAWEAWLKNLGIEWAELDDEVNDAPPGTIAVWEGPGFENRKQCWVVPDDMALKLIALDPSPTRVLGADWCPRRPNSCRRRESAAATVVELWAGRWPPPRLIFIE